MTVLVLIGMAVLAAVAWLVLRLPAPVSSGDTWALRRAQLQASLDELSRARAEGVLDATSFADEQRRLQAEMAALAQPPQPAVQPAPPARTPWPFALAVLVLVPAAAVGLYGYLQGAFWQQMQALRDAPGVAGPVDPVAMVARLEARLAKDGNDVEGWRRLGRSYVVLGRAADARRAYDRAAQLAPDDLTLLEGYAQAAEPGVAPPPAIAAMIARAEQGVVEAPNDPRAWVRAGFARSLLGDRSGARDAYARAHQLAPQQAELLAAYAAAEYALNPQQPSPQAVALYEQLQKIDPDNGSALWVLGLAAQRAGQPAQARERWQRLLEQMPADSPLRAQVQQAIDTLASGAAAP